MEVFHGKEGLLKLAPAWGKLKDRVRNRRHFHRVEWYLALAETFETFGPAGSLICFGFFSSGDLVSALPFRPIQIDVAGIRLRAMQLLSDAWEAETARDFVCMPEVANSDFFQKFVHLLAGSYNSWDVISLRGILEGSFAASIIKSLPTLTLITMSGGSWGKIQLLSCGDQCRPFERLSKGFKQNLRTARNKLTSRDFRFHSAREPDELQSLYPELLAVESSGWKGAQGTSVNKQPMTDAFLRRLISNFGPIGGCEIHTLKVDGRTIGGLFCVIDNDICYILKTGYDECFGNLSPGHLVIEHLLRTRGAAGSLKVMTPYNAPPWFRAWKPDTEISIYNSYVFRPTPYGNDLAHRIASAINTSPATA
jgi:hypothetical protein